MKTEKLGAKGRILVRPSGTEPLIRVMVETKTDALCAQYVNEVVKFLERRDSMKRVISIVEDEKDINKFSEGRKRAPMKTESTTNIIKSKGFTNMLRPTIRKSQMSNRVAVPYGMLDDITAELDASGIEITNVLRRPYVQLQPEERATVMTDLDAADVGGRRLVIEAAGNIDDMRAFVRDRLSGYDRPEQVAAVSSPCDKAHACNTLYSELIDCYYDSIAHGNNEAAAEERKMLQSMWAEYEQTMSTAIDYAHKVDDIANDLALTSLLEDTKRRLLVDGVIDPSL